MSNEMPKRPILRYHGGKWKLAPWIISNLPKHRIYVEPFGGAASVLLRKNRSYAEVYNDLDGEIVNLFRIMRDHGDDLLDRLKLTPFARDEFIESYQSSDDKIEQARRTVVRAFMGFGSSSVTSARHVTSRFTSPSTGFRSNSNRSGNTPAHNWKNYVEAAWNIIERLRGVVIENRNADVIINQHDSKDTLFYIDPPYMPETRDIGNDYRHEMSEEDHKLLAHQLSKVEGMVVLSGYPCALYDEELYKDWKRIECKAFADGAKARVEVIWMNDLASRNCIDLFNIQNGYNQ